MLEQTGDEQKAQGYAALIKRLDDEDGYVVNRAAFTLIKSDLSAAARALLNAAERRPELARVGTAPAAAGANWLR